MIDLISKKEAISHIEGQYYQWSDDYDVLQVIGDLEDMPVVEAVPIDFIRKAIEAYGKDAEEYHKKGQYIMGITALEKHIALSHLIEEWFKERKK